MPEEVTKFILQEGPSFLQMRIKHLMKAGCFEQAMLLSKACTESVENESKPTFQQAYITCLCNMLPSEEAIKEISQVESKQVLDIICNLEAEGQESTAFILCTTYLTQQLQNGDSDCSWELTLFWSKLQRRMDPSIESFLERCRQFGQIAKTVPHLFFLLKVIQAEAEDAGLAASIWLCVRALQIQSSSDAEMKTSVCKTIACLLSEDLEVKRACQLTEFLLNPSTEVYNSLEELYLIPDRKYDEENALIPNSLRCELLLALKAHWPFDPEFWDWKTLKRHCLKLLGVEPHEQSDSDQNSHDVSESKLLQELLSEKEPATEQSETDVKTCDTTDQPERIRKAIGTSKRYQRWLQYKFFCLMCQREVIEARILHHSKMHIKDGVYTCPVCVKNFFKKEVFVPHVMEHVKMPPNRPCPRKKVLPKKPRRFQRCSRRRKVIQEPVEEATVEAEDYITFSHIENNFQLQGHDSYPCPATDCTRVLKQFKYVSIHLKNDHKASDENARHYLEMKNRREKCSYCRRHFMTAFHLRQHQVIHVGPNPYMCISLGCDARFDSVNELLSHKQNDHDELHYKCELKDCDLIFGDLGQLYHHEAQHFRDASYACTFLGCRKFYFSKREYQSHILTHEEPTVNSGDYVQKLGLSETEQSEQKLNTSYCNPPLQAQPLPQVNCRVPDELDLSVTKQKASDFLTDNIAESNVGELFASQKLMALCLPKEEIKAVSEPSEEKRLPGRNMKRIVRYGRKSTATVSACFDGKKFTCGYENCGIVFRRARDMQKHIQMSHRHFKSRRRAGMPVREKGRSIQRTSRRNVRRTSSKSDFQESSLKFSRNSTEESSYNSDSGSCHRLACSTTSVSKSANIEDVVMELLLGIQQLSLNNVCSSDSSTSVSKRFSVASKTNRANTSRSLSANVRKCTSRQQKRDKVPNPAEQEKPFFCQHPGCQYATVTRETLRVHYIRKHNYQNERIRQLEMFRCKFSPFQCHICKKTFTRTAHLRIHYKNKHHMKNDEVLNMNFTVLKFGECSAVPKSSVRRRLKPRSGNRTSPAQVCNSGGANTENQEKYQPRNIKNIDSETDTVSEVSSEELVNSLAVKPAVVSTLENQEDQEAREGRGSKRTVARGNLCYMLDRYHKPFHCIHKGCNSSFTNQKGLIRHYRSVHMYNREQLCLEEDSTETKKDLVKSKRMLTCKYKDCNKRFLCAKALARHYIEFHCLDYGQVEEMITLGATAKFACSSPGCTSSFYTNSSLKRHLLYVHNSGDSVRTNENVIHHCNFSGCERSFVLYFNYVQHVFYQHKEHYEALIGEPVPSDINKLRDGSVLGVKETRLSSGENTQTLQSDRNKQIHKAFLQSWEYKQNHDSLLKLSEMKNLDSVFQSRKNKQMKELFSPSHSRQNSELTLQLVERSRKKPRTEGRRGDKVKISELKLRTREDALKKCVDRPQKLLYPCLFEGCPSVVTLESSIYRHYKRSHQLRASFLEKHADTLIMVVSRNDDQLIYEQSDAQELPVMHSCVTQEEQVIHSNLTQEEHVTHGHVAKKDWVTHDQVAHKVTQDERVTQEEQIRHDQVTQDTPATHSQVTVDEQITYNQFTQSQTTGEVQNLACSLISDGQLTKSTSLNKEEENAQPSSPCGSHGKSSTVEETGSCSQGHALHSHGNEPSDIKECSFIQGSLNSQEQVVQDREVEMMQYEARSPVKTKSETEQTTEMDPPLVQSSALDADESKSCAGSQTKAFDLKDFRPMGFESSFLKFIQECEDIDDEDDLEDSIPCGSPKQCSYDHNEPVDITFKEENIIEDSVQEASQCADMSAEAGQCAGISAEAGQCAGMSAEAGRCAGMSAEAGQCAGMTAEAGRCAGMTAEAGRCAGMIAEAGRCAGMSAEAGQCVGVGMSAEASQCAGVGMSAEASQCAGVGMSAEASQCAGVGMSAEASQCAGVGMSAEASQCAGVGMSAEASQCAGVGMSAEASQCAGVGMSAEASQCAGVGMSAEASQCAGVGMSAEASQCAGVGMSAEASQCAGVGMSAEASQCAGAGMSADKNGLSENAFPLQPLVGTTESPAVLSLQNLRTILDKALTDCGDLALKQLHYLRPVVVLERSKFSSSPLVDLFPTKKNDELCVGSS
ncbi:zinc finger protein Rlf [Protopterus annectens]|uniref:zinc finger protein Rlf n=1 Tax=Protopterus annectens TaxID=7888 RepID=UPI001CF9C101|nr:zinc finger protein Rlf [Protopterus annectens]